MANTQAMCTSFKKELLLGHHNFGVGVIRAATTADTFMASLRLVTDSVGAGTTVYSATGEVSGTNYVAGGITISGWTAPTTTGTSAYTTPTASFTWSALTISTPFDAVQIYNSTQSNKSVSIHTIGSQTVTAGNFSITMPINAAGTALLQLN